MMKKLFIIIALVTLGLGTVGCHHVQTRYSASIGYDAPVVYDDYPVYWDYPIYRRPLYSQSIGIYSYRAYDNHHRRHHHRRYYRRY